MRFVFRFLLLSTFATFGTQGFGTTFAAIVTPSATFCAVAVVMCREAMFGTVFTHWDEAALAPSLIVWFLRSPDRPFSDRAIFIPHL